MIAGCPSNDFVPKSEAIPNFSSRHEANRTYPSSFSVPFPTTMFRKRTDHFTAPRECRVSNPFWHLQPCPALPCSGSPHLLRKLLSGFNLPGFPNESCTIHTQHQSVPQDQQGTFDIQDIHQIQLIKHTKHTTHTRQISCRSLLQEVQRHLGEGGIQILLLLQQNDAVFIE